MKIAVAVFTYHRSYHTEKVLDALKNNTVLPEKLIVFQDGLKAGEDEQEWSRVNRLIQNIDWCDKEIIVSDQNKGLAESIVTGINHVFEKNDAVIVLEDDCVAHPLFMEFVTGCLRKYRDNSSVFSVNGYSWNADVVSNGTDAYFIGRTSSWGWATWKDRWKLYQQDYKILGRIRKDSEKSRAFDVWGQDLEGHLLGNVYGECDSWAVFWALKCIEQGGFCPTPYDSLIENVGFDGTGVHCGSMDIDTRMREWNDRRTIALPDKVEFPENYEIAFSEWFHWTPWGMKLACYNKILLQWNNLLRREIAISEYFIKRNIDSIAVWGRGELCKSLLFELKEWVQINYIIETNPINGQYENISVIRPDEIPDKIQVIVVIPTYDMRRIQSKVKKDNGVVLIGIDEILKELDCR